MMWNTRRFALPLFQVALAISLTASNFLRPNTIANPSWTAPDRQLCWALNAPVAFAMYGLERLADRLYPRSYSIELLLETIVFVVLVGLLWYGVSLEFGGKGQSILTPKTGARSAADVLAVIVGVLVVILGFMVRRQFGMITVYSDLVALPYFIWGAAITIFYGRDLRTSFGAARDKI